MIAMTVPTRSAVTSRKFGGNTSGMAGWHWVGFVGHCGAVSPTGLAPAIETPDVLTPAGLATGAPIVSIATLAEVEHPVSIGLAAAGPAIGGACDQDHRRARGRWDRGCAGAPRTGLPAMMLTGEIPEAPRRPPRRGRPLGAAGAVDVGDGWNHIRASVRLRFGCVKRRITAVSGDGLQCSREPGCPFFEEVTV
jgi:hypothetical protein